MLSVKRRSMSLSEVEEITELVIGAPLKFKRPRVRIKAASARRAVQRARQQAIYEEGLRNNAAVERAHRERLAERNARRNERRQSLRGGVV